MKKKLLYFTLFINCFAFSGLAQMPKTIPLYDGEIPNSKPTPDRESTVIEDGILIARNISRPSLTIYLPEKERSTGTGVIICPGGGYWIEAVGHEGADVAKKFNEEGITAFVLKYRLPDDSTMLNREIGPLQDAQRAIQMVRENAAQYGIQKNRIGIMGFSAGAHLASTAGTHFKKAYIDNPRHTSLKPNFMILVYPVISFNDSFGHIGSRDQLIGKHPSPEKIREYSNELQVTHETPPTFLVHAKDDPVKVQNSLAFAEALKRHHVKHELFLYEKGGHGYGMYNKSSPVQWMDISFNWLKKEKLVR